MSAVAPEAATTSELRPLAGVRVIEFSQMVMGPSCGLILTGATGSGAPAGCTSPDSSLGDQGNLNYGSGDPFTAYLKGNHELLLKFADDWRFMARASWLRTAVIVLWAAVLLPTYALAALHGQTPAVAVASWWPLVVLLAVGWQVGLVWLFTRLLGLQSGSPTGGRPRGP